MLEKIIASIVIVVWLGIASYTTGVRTTILSYCQSIEFEGYEKIDGRYYCQTDDTFELVDWMYK